MNRLLGQEQRELPTTGHNIQIAYHVESIEDGQLVGDMSKELGIIVPILAGQILKYRESHMGIFVINIDDAHMDAAKKYLDSKDIDYKELNGTANEGGE